MFDNIKTPRLLKQQTKLRQKQIMQGLDGLSRNESLALMAATQELDRRCAAGEKCLR
jgi:hypothetical protein